VKDDPRDGLPLIAAINRGALAAFPTRARRQAGMMAWLRGTGEGGQPLSGGRRVTGTDRIEFNPNARLGRAVIRGTRPPVACPHPKPARSLSKNPRGLRCRRQRGGCKARRRGDAMESIVKEPLRSRRPAGAATRRDAAASGRTRCRTSSAMRFVASPLPCF